MLPRSGASAILEGGNVAHLSQSRSPSVSTLSSKPAACRPQRKKKHGSAALHLRDDGLSITGRAIRNESGQHAWLPPGHAARHARQLQRPQSGRWARRRARETCRGRSVRSSTSYIGAHPAPSILAHLTFALAFRPLRVEQPLASLHEFVRELERAPHYRYSSIHCIETLSHPLKARLRDHDKPERSRSQTRRPTGEHASPHHPRTPSLGNACRRQLGSVARHPASEPPRGRDERPTRRSFSSHYLVSVMESDDARAATPSLRNMVSQRSCRTLPSGALMQDHRSLRSASHRLEPRSLRAPAAGHRSSTLLCRKSRNSIAARRTRHTHRPSIPRCGLTGPRPGVPDQRLLVATPPRPDSTGATKRVRSLLGGLAPAPIGQPAPRDVALTDRCSGRCGART